jgi:hypothetical protein
MDLQPQYKRKIEFIDGDNSDIMKVLERNFISARKSVERDGWYKQFEGRNLNETCENVWNFIKENIPYQEDGIHEQRIVMPPRAIANAREGIGTDCKSMALMACAILSHFCDKNVIFRYTSYRNNPTPTHVYCVVDDGRYIVDAVWNKYNSEKPYKYKYDKVMKISTISGVSSPKLQVSKDTYDQIVALDYFRKKAKPGSKEKKLYDQAWAGLVKMEIDNAKENGVNGIDDLDKHVSKIVAQPIGKIERPDWATAKDHDLFLLNHLNPGFVTARASFLLLANLNAFGIIDRLYKEEAKGNHVISRWWYRIGGDVKYLWNTLSQDRNKKPFFGVPAKIMSLIDSIKKKAGIHGVYDSSIDEFSIGVVGADDAVVAGGGFTAIMTTITTAIPALVTLMGAVGNIFDKAKGIPGDVPTIAPGDVPKEPAINKDLIIYGAIGLGAILILPKILKNK